MKVIVFSPTSTMLTPTSITDRPLGGADQALLRMIYALSKQHEVLAYIPIKKAETVKGIEFKPFQDLLNTTIDCDLLIQYRKAWLIPANVTYKKAIFYSQDDADSPCFNGIDPSFFNKFSRVIALSKYHKKRLTVCFGINEEKLLLIGNGADIRYNDGIKDKEPLTFIYASTPFRGLPVLAKMWKEIIKQHPKAILHVFSSMQIYDGETHDQLFFDPLYAKLRTIKGIKYHGSVVQEKVLQHMEKAYALLYPCTFPETYCNVLMEARASETPFITSNHSALHETGGKAGIYIPGNPYSKEYQTLFLEKLFRLLKTPSEYRKMQDHCYPIRTWKDHYEDIQILMASYGEF